MGRRNLMIVDYPGSNAKFLMNYLLSYKCNVTLVNYYSDLKEADGVVLPGVGGFVSAMKFMSDSGIKDYLLEKIEENIPVLGICLGMQILFSSSSEEQTLKETGFTQGLSVLEGSVVRLSRANRKLPIIGWYQLRPVGHRESRLLKDLGNEYFYFNHSYGKLVDRQDNFSVALSTEHDYVTAVEKGNLFGVQFHPEKSYTAGSHLIRNFLNVVKLDQ